MYVRKWVYVTKFNDMNQGEKPVLVHEYGGYEMPSQERAQLMPCVCVQIHKITKPNSAGFNLGIWSWDRMWQPPNSSKAIFKILEGLGPATVLKVTLIELGWFQIT